LNDTLANLTQYPPLYSILIHQQTQIGWRQLFNGQISTEWSRLQEEYLHEQKFYSQRNTGLLWATSLLTSIWDEWHLVWTIRNEVIHGHDKASRQQQERLRAENEIRAIYEDQELLLPADQDHLFDNVDTHLAKSTQALQNWLNTYQLMFTDSIKKAKRRAIDGVRSIWSYFAPT
jgi:hypothetical protein